MSNESVKPGAAPRPQVERRRTPRAPADFAIAFAGPPGTTHEARLRDLSTGGLCCHYGEPLREMTLVDLSLDIPGVQSTQHVQGAVVRSAKVRGVNPPTYEIAVFFTSMSPEARRAIDAYVTARLVS
ncbi:MAG: PilZ domain-containing protein [Planctomycetes bacterium]|nr:PilZ domain-containing protein [Planctomycetota bacterium]